MENIAPSALIMLMLVILVVFIILIVTIMVVVNKKSSNSTDFSNTVQSEKSDYIKRVIESDSVNSQHNSYNQSSYNDDSQSYENDVYNSDSNNPNPNFYQQQNNSHTIPPYVMPQTIVYALFSMFTCYIYHVYSVYKTQSTMRMKNPKAQDPAIYVVISVVLLFMFPSALPLIYPYRAYTLAKDMNNDDYIRSSKTMLVLVAIFTFGGLFMIFFVALLSASISVESAVVIYIMTYGSMLIMPMVFACLGYSKYRKYYHECLGINPNNIS